MNILRRSVMLAPLAFLFPSVAKATPVTSEFGLGKYISHYVVPKMEGAWYDMDKEGNPVGMHRYITFPIEATLTIEYEKGIETYVGFNLNKVCANLINSMDIKDLLKYQVKDDSSDNYSTRFFFEKDKYKIKFWLGSVSYRGSKSVIR